ncbi:POU domain class 2-associating factor 2 isoform X1 [Erpetoichthys calabaricus]|uniref:Si:ch211-213d14.1 n=2 Tax=Erpetoichthys calabaricus TaxID=27687 RepID=A0A8C4XCX4_ERPCA|nr:POU domain class 2-associating factor 2 isoform X1 [Erpetoichthys calabaricus]
METEYSKRVYQGVRVKHTVKDLLAEKRSRQTNVPRFNSGSNSTQPAFVQMSGSQMLSGFYGMRRSFLSDSEFSHCHTTKPFASDVYSTSLGGKPLTCEASSMSGYSSLIDTYYPEPFGDYRTSSFSTGSSPIFSTSALPSLLPPFSGESTHFLLRDTWEQTVPESATQTDGLCSDTISSIPSNNSLTSQESGSPSQHRASSRNTSIGNSQSYALHSLEDVHYPATYPGSSSYSCPPYMTIPSDLPSKISHLAPEGSENQVSAINDTTPSWAKDDGNGTWSPYDIRRAY